MSIGDFKKFHVQFRHCLGTRGDKAPLLAIIKSNIIDELQKKCSMSKKSKLVIS
jgi:hypothetical protein